MRQGGGFVCSFFEGLVLVDALFDEDALERSPEVLLFLLAEEDFQFLAEEILRALNAVAQELADSREEWLLFVDDAAVGRDADFAVGEGIECVNGFVGGNTRGKRQTDVRSGCRHIIDTADTDLALFDSLEDGFDERRRGLPCWEF